MPTSRNATSAKSEPKKATDTKTATKKAAPAVTRAATATTAKPKAGQAPATTRISHAARIEPEQRRRYVEVAAYYIAERRGFVNGDEARDWLTAEEEIDRLLQLNKLNS